MVPGNDATDFDAVELLHDISPLRTISYNITEFGATGRVRADITQDTKLRFYFKLQ